MGIVIQNFDTRVDVVIHCRVDAAYIGDSYDGYEEYYDDENEEDEIDIPILEDGKAGKSVVEQFTKILN